MNKNTSHYRRRKATHVHTNVHITRKMEMENTRKHLARKDNIQTELKEVTPIPALKLTKTMFTDAKSSMSVPEGRGQATKRQDVSHTGW